MQTYQRIVMVVCRTAWLDLLARILLFAPSPPLQKQLQQHQHQQISPLPPNLLNDWTKLILFAPPLMPSRTRSPPAYFGALVRLFVLYVCSVLFCLAFFFSSVCRRIRSLRHGRLVGLVVCRRLDWANKQGSSLLTYIHTRWFDWGETRGHAFQVLSRLVLSAASRYMYATITITTTTTLLPLSILTHPPCLPVSTW